MATATIRDERAARRALRDAGTELRLDAGRVIHRQGDPATGISLVTQGRVHLSVALGGGNELTLADVATGGLLGIVSAVDGGSHTATATTVEHCTLVVVGVGRLQELMDQDAPVAGLLVRELARHLRQADDRLVRHCSETTLQRVVDRLRSLEADRAGRIETTQRELAEWVGATRESTARALGELRSSGAITTGRGWIQIVDDDRLGPTST